MSESQNASPAPSPEQQLVIDTWGKGMAVLAGAGSGKTTTLVSKCAKLTELNPKARFAAVSFTERSASDLRAKLSKALLKTSEPGALYQHWIMTIHGLCGSIIREYPRQAGFDGEESVLADSEAQLLWERAIEALWLEEVPEDVRLGLETLLDRESRDGLSDLLKRLRELFSFGVLGELKDAADPSTLALERVGRYVLERYDRLKRRQGAIDFNDLERGADRALNDQAVREAYHRRFDLILVDEFQDTNPLQAKIIWRLARPDASNLCVVGDPKQSIYRFRDADVSVFEEYCAQLPVRQSLTWNFRSRPGIIEFANQLCEKTFAASQMVFESLVPKREQTPEQETVIRIDVKNPFELAQWIQSEVTQGTPLHQMALLVRKIRGNEKWLKALTSAGIPIAIGSGGLFWEEPRVRELVAFLKWWDNPAHTLSGAIFMRAPWMGIPDADLDQWVKQDSTFKVPFFSSHHPIAQELTPFLTNIVRPGELLMALLINQEMEDELAAPLLGLWHRVEDLSSQGLDFHSVVMELANAVRESRREREVPAPRNLGQLSVLTLHGSKGLEFPHVILIDLGSKSRASDTPMLFWDRKEGVYLGNRDENGERIKGHPKEAPWRDREKEKSLAESKRLFYVALTRAQERLILVCPELKDALETFDSEVAFKQDYWRAWVECANSGISQKEIVKLEKYDSPQNVIHSRTVDRSCPSLLPPMTRARHSVTEWTLLSRCQRAYEWTFIRPKTTSDKLPQIELLIEEEPLDPVVNQLSRSEMGTRVHACLETANFNGLKELEYEVGPSRFLAEPVIQWATNSPWMMPSQREKGRRVWTELSFEVPLGNEVLVGSIDRLVKECIGDYIQYSIIDFKMTEKQKSGSTLIETYQTQIELYAWALTALEPTIQLEDIQAILVNISSGSIQTVPVPLGKINLSRLAEQAVEIINGKEGVPRPGFMCRYCKFQPECQEGREYIDRVFDTP